MMLTIQVPIFLAGLLGGVVTGAPEPDFAAPRIIMLHGGPLEKPVVLTNWWQNLMLLQASSETAPVARRDVDTTQAIQVAMYWGNTQWDGVARDSTLWPQLLGELGQATRGRLYLRPGTGKPLLDYASATSTTGIHSITPSGLALLHRAGVALPGVSDSLLVAGAILSFHQSLSNGDTTGALGWLTPDVVILEAGTRETLQEYRDHHLGADMAYARTTRTTRGPIAVTVVGDVAWAESTSENSRTVEGRTTRSSGAELMVLSRGDEGWRIRAIHWSSRTRRADG